MDPGDLYKASSSLRASTRQGSNIWRNTGLEVFSRSSRDEDDEEALKWAALEKLPTFDRLRKGLLFGSKGANEIDVQNLGFADKRNLVDRLVNTVDEDNEKFLLKLRNRIDRVGIDLPTIEVRYEHLTIDAEAYGQSRSLPTVLNFNIDIIEGILNTLHLLPNRKKPFTILKDVSGVIKPCRMTLLLGPPSSGKTSLLLALAGKLDPTLKVSGRVTFNGHGMNEFVPQRTAAYISQNDLHIGEMTVRETLSFSARCQGVGDRYEMLAELSRREKAANIKPDPDIDIFMKAAATEGDEASVVTDYILKVLGLDVCADTMVGDEMIRGEMLVGPAKALFMDEISTGLDSSTTYQIINMLKQYVHILKGTAFISLLQPAPETYDLFDDIVLLSDGQVVYHGPRENVVGFFESMGFKCPERKGVADFLQEVTSKKDQRQYWARTDERYRFITVSEFAEAFLSYNDGRRLGEELAVPYDKTKSHPAALASKKYGVGQKELLKACTAREALLMKRNSFVYYFKLFQACIHITEILLYVKLNPVTDTFRILFLQLVTMTLIATTVFLRVKMHKDSLADGAIFLGALFFAVILTLFNGLSELALTIYKLPVFYKQRDMYFFPPWAYALPSWVLKIPISFVEVALWTFCSYYVIGFDPNIGRLFKQYLLLLLLHQTAGALFRLIGALGRTMIIANTFGLFALLMLFALGGFVLARNDVKGWWIWGYWASPLMYAQNAILVNEFTGHSWSKVINGTTLGVQVMKSRGFFPYKYWYWIGVGATFGFIWIFNIFYVFALAYLNPLEKPRAVLPDSQNDQQAALVSAPGDAGERRSSSRSSSVVADANENKKEMKTQGATEDRLVLLKNVSGAFRPGVLTALMGVSGAGKTTLMDVLAGRKTGGYIDGNITISGYPKNQATFARISGYCEQNDIHSPNVTVHESLIYSAWLRLPSDVDEKTRKAFIEEVMELVELTPLGGALVGLPGINGLSTEQRKRLTIAVELVANPSIIFMDEPTSGLDARAAAIVMRTVRNTVNTGRTVVCTIHQPSIDIFEAFDELFLMKRGGQEIYVGPLGHQSSQLIKYFEGIQGVAKIKNGINPATWMLEVSTTAQELVTGVDFADYYKKSELFGRNKALIKELSVPRPGTKDLYFTTQFSQPFLVQCMACLWKQHWSYWRNPPYTAVRILFTTFIALIFGTMFWDLGSKWKTQQDLMNAMGSMYAAINFLGFQYSSSVQPVVAIERTVFYREKAAGMYSALPYAFSQFLIELPYVFVQALVYSLLVYSMMGFDWTAEKFFWFLYFMYISLLYFVLYGMMTVAVTPNHNVAAVISSFFYGIWNLFSGFVVPRPRIPIWWRWYYWATPVAYTLYGFIVTQFGEIQDILEDDEAGRTVEQYLKDYFGFERDMLAAVALILFGFVILFTFIFAYSIKTFNFQRR
ncbi:Pleiotropic drug resistance 12 [Dorcoceras hygrometricum]|uniref:Pleiotropic drug resistance 12 n=1 Tax=Dorcoceras hygrometricum TaxID=472368 RepID=A0A2Z7B1U7_9LAMI|nr:Pleiotropic drug resistance 12 [Dorcoceras hygrometricum]